MATLPTTQTSKPSLITFILTGFTVRPVLCATGVGKALIGKYFMTLATLFMRVRFKMGKMFYGFMYRLRSKIKIFNSVIKFITIFMVDYFYGKWQQLSAYALLHYVSMLIDLLTVYPNLFIATCYRTHSIRTAHKFGLPISVIQSPVSIAKAQTTMLPVVRRFFTPFDLANRWLAKSHTFVPGLMAHKIIVTYTNGGVLSPL